MSTKIKKTFGFGVFAASDKVHCKKINGRWIEAYKWARKLDLDDVDDAPHQILPVELSDRDEDLAPGVEPGDSELNEELK